MPEDLERFVRAKVQSGRFASSEDAFAEAVRLLMQREEAEEARVMEGIRRGLDDVREGRTQPLLEAFSEIRGGLNLPPGP